MPYKIVKQGNRYAVVKATDTSKVFGKHKSILDAQRQIRAIHANSKEGK